jgi:hypothetical protein
VSKSNGCAAAWVNKVDVPGWRPGVYVRKLSSRMAAKFGALADFGDSQEEQVELMIRVCALGACDKHGAALFTDEDLDALRDAPWMEVQETALEFLAFNNLDGKKKKGSRRKKGLRLKSP